jgi:hypothetical protein
MSGKIIGIALLGMVSIGIMSVVGGYVSAYNTANSLEQQIKAAWTNNENILASYSTRLREAAQVTEMQRDDVRDVLSGAISARYGTDGSQATMQWIQEQNPNLSTDVYTQLMRLVEAGRIEFRVGQTSLIDKKRAYETALGSLFQGTMMSFAGFPRIDLDEYQIISTNYARGAFETGIADEIQLRQ